MHISLFVERFVIIVVGVAVITLLADAADNTAAAASGSSIMSGSAAVANREEDGNTAAGVSCLQGGRVADGTTNEVCFPMQTNVGYGQGDVVGEVCLSIVVQPTEVVEEPTEVGSGGGSSNGETDGSSTSGGGTTSEENSTLLLQVRTINTKQTPPSSEAPSWELVETRLWVGTNAWNIPKLPDRSSVDVNQFTYVWTNQQQQVESETETTTQSAPASSNTWSLPNPCATNIEENNIMANNSPTKTMVFVVQSIATKTTTSTTNEEEAVGDSLSEEKVTLWGYEHLTRSVPAPWFDVQVICDCTNKEV